eukprot:CAMPEP_0197921484 /NCGR_PEP_ID=MMETSP1439-20131203/90729_1 /TAXON_ID=66791 /ORGANISM="Gonyaulax spinifera, Strain CCMP409" /LENGTH=194 /DNA_ID=CAMNT_0043543739 /DNA_START=56 /DNA_END=637 /DNA_ORIENTATION=+
MVPSAQKPSSRPQRRVRSSALLPALLIAGVAYLSLQARAFLAGGGAASARGSLAAGRTHAARQTLSLRRAAEVAEATDTNVETFDFQAEVGKVMDIIVNSLYSNKDVFLRELVSNAADACDKKRFLALTEGDAPPEAMKLRIRADKEARTLTIEDNGVGMRKEELKENLGRIARSGTANFVEQLGSGEDDVSLI